MPTICLLSKSFEGSLLVSCDCCHVVAPVFRSLDSISLIVQIQLFIVVRLKEGIHLTSNSWGYLEVIDHDVIVITDSTVKPFLQLKH